MPCLLVILVLRNSLEKPEVPSGVSCDEALLWGEGRPGVGLSPPQGHQKAPNADCDHR